VRDLVIEKNAQRRVCFIRCISVLIRNTTPWFEIVRGIWPSAAVSPVVDRLERTID
jgi:hypothetical protein